MTNLVDNALRHNVAGGRIWLSTGTARLRATVSVANTGAVVPAAAVGRLFEPFERLGAERTGAERTGHDGGLGLGLSIVQAVAVAHDADITAHARPGGGLQIDVAFPGVPVGHDV